MSHHPVGQNPTTAGRYRRLSFEPLEVRTMLAGDVVASVIDGDLVLTGDAGDNVILIRPSVNVGQILLIGVRGTTINGVPGTATATGVTDDILASLGGGDDRFVITNLHAPSDIKLDIGDGNNKVKLDRLTTPGDVSIEGGAVRDGVFIRGIDIGGELNVDMGDGDNHLTVLNSSINGAATVVGGAQRDRVETLRAAFDESFSVDLAADRDRLVSVRSKFKDSSIGLGSGADKMVLILAATEGAFDADGSDGDDLFVNTSNLFDVPPSILSFETVT